MQVLAFLIAKIFRRKILLEPLFKGESPFISVPYLEICSPICTTMVRNHETRLNECFCINQVEFPPLAIHHKIYLPEQQVFATWIANILGAFHHCIDTIPEIALTMI